jgi:hypothetical protein
MVPALWRALTACPHGDLSPGDLMLERAQGIFRIFDPGVRIRGPEHHGSPSSLSFESELLTTNAVHYPLLEPEAGPDRPRWCAPLDDLCKFLELQTGHLFAHAAGRQSPAPPGPSVADVIACGAVYFAVLAGTSLAAHLGITAPLWTGLWSDWGDLPPPRRDVFDLLVPGALTDLLRATGASAAECALCEHLVLADLDEESATRHAVDALRSLEAH